MSSIPDSYAKHPKYLKRRLMKHKRVVKLPHMKTACWEFKGTIRDGYGCLNIKGRHIRAHRLAAFLWLPDFKHDDPDLVVCHRCDNRKCFRPKHLFIGDRDVNNKDTARKKRIRNQHTGRLSR